MSDKEVTVKDLKEWLDNFDDDVIVKFLEHTDGTGYDSYGDTIEINPVLTKDAWDGEGWEYTDFRSYKHVLKPKPYYNKQYLLLGEK